uniref:Thioester reductase domain-containing protein n=1 Tax=Candidatus Kentrum sp. LPFa TaxID=2126335 RepID=A0A450WPS0_9GAMM|nr:MAG: thioester reductase domain-containing protein [Candidatus Kentron sp. LPFa]
MDLRSEAILAPTIRFDKPLAENSIQPESVFLTGATGFLGAYLLAELLRKTAANVYCLVRCEHPDEGKLRLQNALRSYSLWKEEFSSRVIPVVGDLSKPLLGLSEAYFGELAGRLNVIYHNGAQISFIRPYSALKKTNVFGTQEVLRLAGLIKTKPVHFVSSMAVFLSQTGSPMGKVLETDIPEFNPGMKMGYGQSKWVAERLVMVAQERGLPATIHRAVRIMGDTKTGVMGNLDDSLCRLMKGCIQLGKFPALDIPVTFIPVDYTSQAIIYLSLKEDAFGKAFHLFNPHVASWKILFNKITSLGYALEEVAYENWLEELKRKESEEPKNKLYQFLLLFLRSPNNLFAPKPQFDARYTFERLSDASIFCPSVDKLVPVYFSYFQEISYIPSP